jgi:hypothetical protein
LVERKSADEEKQRRAIGLYQIASRNKRGEMKIKWESAYLNIQELFSKNGWTIVDGLS